MVRTRRKRFPRPIPNPLQADRPADPSLSGESPIEEDTLRGIQLAKLSKLSKMPDLGPLNPFLKDPDVTEILVNGTQSISIEKNGTLETAGFSFKTIHDLERLARNIIESTNEAHELSNANPVFESTLPDGARVHIVSFPITQNGPCFTIRKLGKPLSASELVAKGTLDQTVLGFLRSCVIGKQSILISGGTGSGKTTLLNSLANLIPKNERIVTIEDIPELKITNVNHVSLLTAPQYDSRALVAQALRLRPDRILVGECRRGEALDMLQAMNTGHEGSLTTLHANSPRDALSRLETLCLTSGVELPLSALRRQIARAIQLIVQIRRRPDGSRKVERITEVTGLEGETITLQDIFEEDFKFTGFVPNLIERLKEKGIDLPLPQ